jgi:hypothetical protein
VSGEPLALASGAGGRGGRRTAVVAAAEPPERFFWCVGWRHRVRHGELLPLKGKRKVQPEKALKLGDAAGRCPLHPGADSPVYYVRADS